MFTARHAIWHQRVKIDTATKQPQNADLWQYNSCCVTGNWRRERRIKIGCHNHVYAVSTTIFTPFPRVPLYIRRVKWTVLTRALFNINCCSYVPNLTEICEQKAIAKTFIYLMVEAERVVLRLGFSVAHRPVPHRISVSQRWRYRRQGRERQQDASGSVFNSGDEDADDDVADAAVTLTTAALQLTHSLTHSFILTNYTNNHTISNDSAT